jgi:uncharacterized surface protein with fasciclin (FAS1) repeats
MTIKPLALALLSAAALSACMGTAATRADAPGPAAMATPADPDVGGAPMYASKDIIDNAVNSKDHTTLVAAVKAAGLVDTLKGDGPFTVFAPTNAAFDALPKGTVDALLQPDRKADLAKVLTYHVVAGKLDAAALQSQIAAGGGKAVLTTVQGEPLTATERDGGIALADAKGNVAMVTIADVMQRNGVIHVIDKVLMP